MNTPALPQPRSRLRRIVQNPLSSTFLTALLLMAGSLFFVTYAQPRSVYVLRDRDATGAVSFRIVDEDVQSWDELAKITQQRPGDLVRVHSAVTGRTDGFLFPTRRRNWPELAWIGKPFEAAEEPQVRETVATWLEQTHYRSRAALMRMEEPTSILWSGYLLNVLAAALVWTMVWSWGWALLIPSWIRGARHRRGVCVRCKYDLSKTRGDSGGTRTCPECGTFNPPSLAPSEPRP